MFCSTATKFVINKLWHERQNLLKLLAKDGENMDRVKVLENTKDKEFGIKIIGTNCELHGNFGNSVREPNSRVII